MLRYRFYRVHKYVSFVLSDFSRAVGKADFTIDAEVEKIKDDFAGIVALMHSHAKHEDKCIHPLLAKKGSRVHEETEKDHAEHGDLFSTLEHTLNLILASKDHDQRIEYGCQFHIGFQRFEANNILHQLYEETVIMPELQRLYTDEELLTEVEAKVYRIMTVDQIMHMLQVLFPHFNKDDQEAFLNEIKTSEPEKYKAAWPSIASLIIE